MYPMRLRPGPLGLSILLGVVLATGLLAAISLIAPGAQHAERAIAQGPSGTPTPPQVIDDPVEGRTDARDNARAAFNRDNSGARAVAVGPDALQV
ncbi:MAG TPA: hypothetical protein VIY56_18570, partial [Vicinamibacterales bacterium]